MTTLEKLNAQLQTLKLQIKVAEAMEVINEAYENRDNIYFINSLGEKRFLFTSHLFSCGRMQIKVRDVKFYNELYQIVNDEKCTQTKEIMKAVRIIEKNEEVLSTM